MENVIYRMSLPDIPYEVLESKIAKSVCNVCETMVGESCVFTGSEDLSKTQISTPRLGNGTEGGLFVGSVGFVGEMNGVVYLFFNPSLIEKIATRITNKATAHSVPEMAFDVCGELANVVGGGFKGSLEVLGHKSKLTIPMSLFGDELFISTMGVKQYVRAEFTLFGERFVVDSALAELI